MSEHPLEPLGSICEINSDTLTEASDPTRRYRYIDLSSIKEQKADLSITPLPFAVLPSRARRRVAFNDVLLGTVRPNLKNFAIIDSEDEDLLCSTGFAVLRSKANASDPRFIFHAINSEIVARQLNALVTGSNYPAVNATQVGELLIPVPPLPEQKKIAEILSGIDKRREATTKKAANILRLQNALREKIFSSLHGERVPLGEICNPKQWQTISTTQLTASGYPVYGANGMIGYFSEFNHKDPVLAVTCRGATCGNLTLVPEFSYVTGNSMCLDNPRSDTSPEYLFHFLSWRGLKDVISGSAQPQITRSPLQAVEVVLPSVEKQDKIVSALESVSNMEHSIKTMLDRLDLLKQALSSDLLSGRKRVSV